MSTGTTIKPALESIRVRLLELECAALWVSHPANVRYLSGFTTPKDAKLLITLEGEMLYTDNRYLVQARLESRVPQHIARGKEVLEHAKILIENRPTAFEAEATSYANFMDLQACWQVPLRPVKGLIEPLRLFKSPEEIGLIRQAAQIADQALTTVSPHIKAGVRECDVALELEVTMRRLGAEGAAFEIIVASGLRSAMPHGVASSKTIDEGDLVTVDMGALYQGYHSDITRTFAVGQIADRLREIQNTVFDAQAKALDFIRAGVRSFDADKTARDHIIARGFGEHFGHSLGHGVGLEIHEGPRASYLAEPDERLEVGMVLTIEPGIYVPDVGGARIEDLVLVTPTGAEVLTQAPKTRL